MKLPDVEGEWEPADGPMSGPVEDFRVYRRIQPKPEDKRREKFRTRYIELCNMNAPWDLEDYRKRWADLFFDTFAKEKKDE